MKIGISIDLDDKSRYGRFGEQMFSKLVKHGFSCIDCNISGTNTWYYTMDKAEMETEINGTGGYSFAVAYLHSGSICARIH